MKIEHTKETKEILIRCCADIASELVKAHKSGKDINLNGIRSRVSRKYKVKTQPRLTDIIAAIPEQYKPALLPKIKAKPIRTASGVRICFFFFFYYFILLYCIIFYYYIIIILLLFNINTLTSFFVKNKFNLITLFFLINLIIIIIII